jgi:haloalkane dehalogenase
MAVELRVTDRFAYREAVPEGEEIGPPVLLVHGFPESSLMWAPVMEALAGAGRRSVAPDLYCLGDSPDPGPATFERNLAALTELHRELGLGRVAVVVHDWGGFIGLAWACEPPAEVAALVISDTGFFADGRWHGMAEAIRGEHGEELVGALEREGFAGLLRSDGAHFDEATVDAYWRPFEAGRGRQATVEFYRSMDMEKLAPYDGRLGELGIPTLLLWGAEDKFAPIGGAKRFEREIPGAKLVAIEGAGHFVFDQEPERCAREVVSFLTDARP